MKWIHARKGEIEGKIVYDDGIFVDIELAKKARVGWAPPAEGYGFRSVYAADGQILRVRKTLLKPVPSPNSSLRPTGAKCAPAGELE